MGPFCITFVPLLLLQLHFDTKTTVTTYPFAGLTYNCTIVAHPCSQNGYKGCLRVFSIHLFTVHSTPNQIDKSTSDRKICSVTNVLRHRPLILTGCIISKHKNLNIGTKGHCDVPCCSLKFNRLSVLHKTQTNSTGQEGQKSEASVTQREPRNMVIKNHWQRVKEGFGGEAGGSMQT